MFVGLFGVFSRSLFPELFCFVDQVLLGLLLGSFPSFAGLFSADFSIAVSGKEQVCLSGAFGCLLGLYCVFHAALLRVF